MTWYIVRTLNCPSIIRPDDENLRTAPVCISQDFSAARLDATQCSISYGIFFPKHKYEKTVATVRTMWIPVRTRSSIRQVVHSKSRRLDTSLHGLDVRSTYMEIACIRSTVRTTCPMVWMREPLIWKLLAAKVRPSWQQGNTIQTRLNSRKNLCKIWKADRTVVHQDTLCLPPRRGLGISSQTLIWICNL
jgi:hypothetical protein